LGDVLRTPALANRPKEGFHIISSRMFIEFRGGSAEFRRIEFEGIVAPAFLIEKDLVAVWRLHEIHWL